MIQVIKGSRTDLGADTLFMIALTMMNIRLYIWLMPWAAPPILDLCRHEGERQNENISQYR
jgi:hypothetical protein